MKPKVQTKKNKPLAGIPAAYDLKEAKGECKALGLWCKPAIAWLQGGLVQVSIDKEHLARQDSRRTRDEILHEWLKELPPVLAEEALVDDASPKLEVERRYARCVATSRGASWHAWKDLDVCSYLLYPEGTPAISRKGTIIPVEDTIFDTDNDPCASLGGWRRKGEIKACYVNFGKYLLGEIARVYCLAVEMIENFEQTFKASEPPPDAVLKSNEGTRPAWFLHKSKSTTMDMLRCLLPLDMDSDEPDAATHMRLGFRIGKWLAQAEAIISIVRDQKLLAQQGDSGQHPSPFWAWVIAMHETKFKGKTVLELFGALAEQPDPEFEGYTLKIIGDKLVSEKQVDGKWVRSEKRPVKALSFASAYSRARTRASEKINS